MLQNIYMKFKKMKPKNKKTLFISLIIISIIIRFSFFSLKSDDFVIFLNDWLNHIKNNGNFSSLSSIYESTNCNYYLPYLFLLSLFSYLPLSNVIIIKLISIIFEYICAYFIYKTIFHFNKNKSLSILVSILFLFLPSIIINGSMWGQCDIMFSTFIIMSLYFIICKNKNKLGLLLYFFALTFKLQAIFISPLYLIMLFTKKIHIKDMLYVGIATLIMLGLNYLIFNDFIYPLDMSYLSQASQYSISLTFLAPNFHIAMFSFGIRYSEASIKTIILAMNIIFIISTFLFCIYFYKKTKFKKNKNIIYYYIASFFGLFCPYFMVNMHERYFFILNALLLIILFIKFNKKLFNIYISFIFIDFLTLIQVNWIHAEGIKSTITNQYSLVILVINAFLLFMLLFLIFRETMLCVKNCDYIDNNII